MQVAITVEKVVTLLANVKNHVEKVAAAGEEDTPAEVVVVIVIVMAEVVVVVVQDVTNVVDMVILPGKFFCRKSISIIYIF